MKFIYLFMLLVSTIFIFMNHPICLSFLTILQTIMISLLMNNLYLNFWFSYIIILVMIGGMLIIFMYMTNVASNEKFNMSKNLKMIMLFLLITSIMMSLKIKKFNNFISFNYNMLDSKSSLILMKFFNWPSNYMMMLMMFILLLTLLMTTKMTNFKEGPLRQKL